jgi:hypothetical protein
MTWQDADEAILKGLAELRPDPSRAACVRARCRAELERRGRRSRRVTATAGFGRQVAAPLFTAALSAVYAAALFEAATRILKR